MNLPLSVLLGVLFIGLKLTNYIDWSWVWVLSPFWIVAVLYVLCLVVFCSVAAFTGVKITKSKKKNENN